MESWGHHNLAAKEEMYPCYCWAFGVSGLNKTRRWYCGMAILNRAGVQAQAHSALRHQVPASRPPPPSAPPLWHQVLQGGQEAQGAWGQLQPLIFGARGATGWVLTARQGSLQCPIRSRSPPSAQGHRLAGGSMPTAPWQPAPLARQRQERPCPGATQQAPACVPSNCSPPPHL